MKKLINLTRHNITLKQLGSTYQFPISGEVARVTESTNYLVRDGLLLKEITDQRLVGLPESDADSIYIVSRVVAEHSRRQDLLFPDDLIIENGQILGCKALGVLRSKPALKE